MCHLNAMIRAKTGRDDLLETSLARSLAISYERNNHAEGIYYSGNDLLIKSKDPLVLFDEQLRSSFACSKFVLAHARIATRDNTEKSHQPFMTKRFVLAHNGMLSIKKEFDYPDYSDTYALFKMLEKMESADADLKVDAAFWERLFSIVESGSYSIMLYDKLHEVLYYVKNSATSIYAGETGDGLFFMSTCSSNLDWFKVKTNYKVEDEHIYCVKIVKGVPVFYDLGVFNCPFKSYKYYNYNKTSYVYGDKSDAVDSGYYNGYKYDGVGYAGKSESSKSDWDYTGTVAQEDAYGPIGDALSKESISNAIDENEDLFNNLLEEAEGSGYLVEPGDCVHFVMENVASFWNVDSIGCESFAFEAFTSCLEYYGSEIIDGGSNVVARVVKLRLKKIWKKMRGLLYKNRNISFKAGAKLGEGAFEVLTGSLSRAYEVAIANCLLLLDESRRSEKSVAVVEPKVLPVVVGESKRVDVA